MIYFWLMSVFIGIVLGWGIALLVCHLQRSAMRQKAIAFVARKERVSPEYIRVVIENFEACADGRQTADEWMRRAMQIEYRYPLDSGMREQLLQEEFEVPS